MYQALYRKYRPNTFDEILGQGHITTTLKHQVVNNNLSHAYLFSGTRGTGKTTAAKVFSRAINCLNPQEGNPCNECENCIAIMDETTMDVIEMDAASNNGVDDIRDLRDKVIYPPTKVKYKVYIIDEVHMLSKGAFNALLKTLEEPPKHLVFILATTEKEKLPPTIVSRCQRFDFKRVSTKDIVFNMRKITESLDIRVDDETLNLISRNADGAMRDALSLLDQCISYGEKEINYEDAIDILGIANKDVLFKMVDSIISKDLDQVLTKIDTIIQDGKDINQFIKDISNHLRDLLIVKTSKNAQDILESPDIELLMEQGKKVETGFFLNALDILTEAGNKAKWATQPRIILEIALINIVNMESISLIERVKRLEEKLSQVARGNYREEVKAEEPKEKPEVESKKPTKPIVKDDALDTKGKTTSIIDATDLNIDIVTRQWPKILQLIKGKKINIYALLVEAEPLKIENNMITVGYESNLGFHREAINSKQNKEFVEEVVSNFFNMDIIFNFIMKSALEKKTRDIDANIDDEIQKVQDFFGKDIVKII